MDELKQSAMNFEKLLKHEYEIIAGSKQTLVRMLLFFSKEHFMHLIGLHKLTDLPIKRHSKEKLYDMVMNEELTYEYIQKSVFFPEVKERIELFAHLEEALDSNELMIKYKKGHAKGTLIKATYVIVYQYKDMILHYFIDEMDNTGRYYGKSFFGRKDNKFLENQQTFKILKKYKYNKVDGTMQTLCDKPLREQNRKENVPQN